MPKIESVGEFLERGGKITHCPPCAPGCCLPKGWPYTAERRHITESAQDPIAYYEGRGAVTSDVAWSVRMRRDRQKPNGRPRGTGRAA